VTAARSAGILPAVVAAAVALASGCLLEPDPPAGSAAIYWTFWSWSMNEIGDVLTDGATSICTRAAVDEVRIALAGPAAENAEWYGGPCITPEDVPAAAFDGMPPGTWRYTLVARRGGVEVFEAQGELEVVDGERTIVDVRARPPPGHWDVAFTYATTGCVDGDRLRFELVDLATLRPFFSTDDAQVNPPVTVPCVHSEPFTIPSVPPGAYQSSDWVQVDAAGAVERRYSACRPNWTQTSTGSTAVDVDVSALAPPAYPGLCL
jgi:hypothetical protein